MKINPSTDTLQSGKAASAPATERAATGAPAPASAGAPGTAGTAGDTIHLSALSTQLQALEASLTAGGEFDRTKVEAIKTAIREGRLSVNAEVVASRMLETTLALVRKGA